MSKVWDPQELSILSNCATTCTTSEIQEILSLGGFERTVEAINKKRRKHNWFFVDFGTPPGPISSAIQQVLAKRITAAPTIQATPPQPTTSTQKGKMTATINTELNKIYKDLLEIREAVPYAGSKDTRGASGGTSLVILLSDLHVGKVLYDETDTVIYNSEIACRRIQETPQMIYSALPSPQEVTEIVILCLGDQIDGEGIYPGQDLELECGVPQQVRLVTSAVWSCIKQLRAMFPLVRIVTTRGNHGRSGTGGPEANFDNMHYWGLELLVDMEADPGLTIKNRFGEYNTFSVQGWKGLIRHKAPAQADTAAAKAQFSGWKDIHRQDVVCYGHWHHWGVFTHNDMLLVRNGGLCGGDDYAEEFGSWDAPTQMAFGVTADALPAFILPLKYN